MNFNSIEVPKNYSVTVSWATTPTHVYVNIHDMQFPEEFELFNDWLGSEYHPTPAKDLQIGDVCLVSYQKKWCRALGEDVKKDGVRNVFLVDYGHRLDDRYGLWKLPEKSEKSPKTVTRFPGNGVRTLSRTLVFYFDKNHG